MEYRNIFLMKLILNRVCTDTYILGVHNAIRSWQKEASGKKSITKHEINKNVN